MTAGSSIVAMSCIRPAQRGQHSTSRSKDHLSYCTSYRGAVLGTRRSVFAWKPAVGWTVLLGSIQPLAHLVADPRLEASLVTPPADGRPPDAELGGDLRAGQHAGGEQAFLEAREPRRGSDPLDADRIEGLPGAGPQAALVEDRGDLGVGVLVQERVHLLPRFGTGGAQLPGGQGAGERQGRGRPAPEPDMRRDLALLEQGDILDEEGEHPLALTLGGVRVPPDSGDVYGEGEDALPVLLVDGHAIGGALVLVLLLGLGEGAQPAVPVGFQRIRDQAVRRVHLHIAVPGPVSFVLGPLDLPPPQTIGVVEAGLD